MKLWKRKTHIGDLPPANMTADAFNEILAMIGSERRVQAGDPIDASIWKEVAVSIYDLQERIVKLENQA